MREFAQRAAGGSAMKRHPTTNAIPRCKVGRGPQTPRTIDSPRDGNSSPKRTSSPKEMRNTGVFGTIGDSPKTVHPKEKRGWSFLQPA